MGASPAWQRRKRFDKRLEIEARVECCPMNIEIAIRHTTERILVDFREVTEHILIKEHLESVSGREIDMPIVIVEIRAPAEPEL